MKARPCEVREKIVRAIGYRPYGRGTHRVSEDMNGAAGVRRHTDCLKEGHSLGRDAQEGYSWGSMGSGRASMPCFSRNS